MNEQGDIQSILVTGVTGYVGGRLVPRLLNAGYHVRVLVRGSAERLNGRPWKEEVEIATGDVFDPTTLLAAMQGIDAAYYLIHSMGGQTAFSDRDVQAADNFAAAAEHSGMRRIIYLGGLGDQDSHLSEHFRLRRQTGDALRHFKVPVTEFQTGLIIGSGSLAFEMMRSLAERLPLMVAPRWVSTKTQPIATEDVLDYLIAALHTAHSTGKIIEIGGTTVLTYADMLLTYARIRGLRRVIIRLPVLTPRLSSYWVHWMTPVSAAVSTPVIEGLSSELVVRDHSARTLFPAVEPLSYEETVRLALARIEDGDIETLWSDALASSQGDLKPVNLTHEQGMLMERRQMIVDASPAAVFQSFCALGGDRGWPSFQFLWQLRGALDRLVGGVGMRRGRRHPFELRQGEALDFWRVELVEADHLLRLRAEMKTPGMGWLQFEANSREDGRTDLVQTAYFASKGLPGLLYWYSLYPIHGLIFSKLIKVIAQQATHPPSLSPPLSLS